MIFNILIRIKKKTIITDNVSLWLSNNVNFNIQISFFNKSKRSYITQNSFYKLFNSIELRSNYQNQLTTNINNWIKEFYQLIFKRLSIILKSSIYCFFLNTRYWKHLIIIPLVYSNVTFMYMKKGGLNAWMP